MSCWTKKSQLCVICGINFMITHHQVVCSQTCRRERRRENNLDRHRRDRDLIAAKAREYYQNNKERVSEVGRRYRLLNKEKVRERRFRWKALNKEKIKRQARKYRQFNRARINERERLRRNRSEESKERRREICRAFYARHPERRLARKGNIQAMIQAARSLNLIPSSVRNHEAERVLRALGLITTKQNKELT